MFFPSPPKFYFKDTDEVIRRIRRTMPFPEQFVFHIVPPGYSSNDLPYTGGDFDEMDIVNIILGMKIGGYGSILGFIEQQNAMGRHCNIDDLIIT